MAEEIRRKFTQYIRAKLWNENLLKKYTGYDTSKITAKNIDDFIDQENKKERLPGIKKQVGGKAIQNVINKENIKCEQNTLEFLTILFDISPKTLVEFSSQWTKGEITEPDLVIKSGQKQPKESARSAIEVKAKTGDEDLKTGPSSLKQINWFSAFNFSSVKKWKGKIKQLNIFGFGNKQEIDGDV